MAARIAHLPLLCVALLAAGCAQAPVTRPDPRDRFERVNRSVFAFNQGLDKHLARPVAETYEKVAPQLLRTGVSNFFANLGYPVVIVNDLLQAKPLPFAKDSARFAVNTTVGLAGLFDPATKIGLDSNNEDFGQTLGSWGLPPGPYLMLPLLGPSDARDLVGKVADRFTQPQAWVNDSTLKLELAAGELVDQRAAALEASDVMNRAFDPYAFMRNAYLQRRQFLVYDGNPPEEAPSDDATDDSAGEQ